MHCKQTSMKTSLAYSPESPTTNMRNLDTSPKDPPLEPLGLDIYTAQSDAQTPDLCAPRQRRWAAAGRMA